MTGLSQIGKERAKAKAPGLPIDLIQRSVKTEVPEKQELHRLMEVQHIKVMTKQDEIPYQGQKDPGQVTDTICSWKMILAV